MVRNAGLSHKIDYITFFYEILNTEGYQNLINGSRLIAIFLNGWIFPIPIPILSEAQAQTYPI